MTKSNQSLHYVIFIECAIWAKLIAINNNVSIQSKECARINPYTINTHSLIEHGLIRQSRKKLIRNSIEDKSNDAQSLIEVKHDIQSKIRLKWKI